MTASLTKLSQQVLIHLFTTSNSSVRHTAISRKVVGKNVHANIPKSNYGIRSSVFLTVTTLVVEPTFVAFLLTVANICPSPPASIISNFFEEQLTQNHPQYLSGLSRALFPTTFLKIAVETSFKMYMGHFGVA